MTDGLPEAPGSSANPDLLADFYQRIEFEERLRREPDQVTDDEIRAEYAEFGDELDPATIRDMSRRRTFGVEPRNPRASARAKLRVRLLHLQRVMSDVELAINGVLDAPGRTNSRGDLELLRKALSTFRLKTGLTGDGLEIGPKRALKLDHTFSEELLDQSIFNPPPLFECNVTARSAGNDAPTQGNEGSDKPPEP